MNTVTPTPTLLRRRDVETRTGLKRSAIYKLMSAGTFPTQVKLGIGACVAWVESDVDQWIQDQIDSGRHVLPKQPTAAENFLREMLGRGEMPEPILRNRAEVYGINWSLIEAARDNGIVTTAQGDTSTPQWSLVTNP